MRALLEFKSCDYWKKYLQFLHEVRTLPRFARIDCGTETGKMATIQSYLSSKVSNLDDPVDSVIRSMDNIQNRVMVERST